MAVIFILLYPLALIFSKFLYSENNPRHLLEAISMGGDISTVLASPEAVGAINVWIINNLLQITILGIIMVVVWVYSSATPGKWLLRMRIVDEKTGYAPSTKQFIIRYLSCFVSPTLGMITAFFVVPILGFYVGLLVAIFIACIGFFWIGWDKEKQGWHDKIAGTVVIKVKHWRPKASTESEFPDSWFEDENEDDEDEIIDDDSTEEAGSISDKNKDSETSEADSEENK